MCNCSLEAYIFLILLCPASQVLIFLHGFLTYNFRYIVKKDAPGLTVTKIENKIGLRIVQNGDILLSKVFVPDEDRIPGVNSFQDTNKVRLCMVFSLLLFK